MKLVSAPSDSARAVFFRACSSLAAADWAEDAILLAHVTADDWRKVGQWAERHGLAGHVLRGLGYVPIDPAVRSRLEAVRDARLDLQLRRRPATATAIRALELAGIQPIVLKGYALAEEVYGSLSDRAFGDCDLLVPAAAFESARRVLADLGFRPSLPEPNLANEHGIDLRRSDGSRIDLHWALADEIATLDEGHVWGTAVGPRGSGRLGGLRLSPELTLIHLAAHLAHHDFRSVKPWVDFYVVARRLADEIDPERLRTQAARFGVGDLLNLTLLMCGLHFRPSPEVQRLSSHNPSWRVRWAAASLKPALLLATDETPADIWRASARRRVLTGRPGEVVAWISRWLFPGREALASKFRKPFSWGLYPRYYGLQMARVLGRSRKLFKDYL